MRSLTALMAQSKIKRSESQEKIDPVEIAETQNPAHILWNHLPILTGIRRCHAYLIFNMYEIGLHAYQKTVRTTARNSEFLTLSTVAVTNVCSIFKKFTK